MKALPLVAFSDVTARTDIAANADVLLPAAGKGEKSGTVTNSERRISRQVAFPPPQGEARPDWWALAQVGRRLGWPEAIPSGHRLVATALPRSPSINAVGVRHEEVQLVGVEFHRAEVWSALIARTASPLG